MSRRIEVELTSARDDGSWTWRAAGARQPKGVVEAKLVPDGAKVGDVLRVEAEFDLDGVTVVSVAPAQEKKRNEPERIEVIGRPPREDQLVTSTLTSKPKRERRDRDRDRDRERDRDGDRPSRDRKAPAARREGERSAGRDRPREDRERTPPRERAERRPPRTRPEEPAKPKPKRLRPARVHRSALLEELPPEHRPIAEQVLQGDIPAVRQAIEKENEGRVAKGEPTINGQELLALAEKMRPRLRTAEWRDRADAALADVEELDLRDLRSVVVAADSAARDDETRALAAQLREALTRRVEHEQSSWLAELTETLNDGRVVRALRLSSRPPKAGTILPAELTTRLAEAANAQLTSDAGQDRWAIVLDAVAYSPVRPAVKPQSLPATPGDELLAVVRKLSSRLPDIAAAFGIEPAPEPARTRGPRRPAGKSRPAPSGQRPPRPDRRPPPPPPRPPRPVPAEAGESPAPQPTAPTTAKSLPVEPPQPPTETTETSSPEPPPPPTETTETSSPEPPPPPTARIETSSPEPPPPPTAPTETSSPEPPPPPNETTPAESPPEPTSAETSPPQPTEASPAQTPSPLQSTAPTEASPAETPLQPTAPSPAESPSQPSEASSAEPTEPTEASSVETPQQQPTAPRPAESSSQPTETPASEPPAPEPTEPAAPPSNHRELDARGDDSGTDVASNTEPSPADA